MLTAALFAGGEAVCGERVECFGGLAGDEHEGLEPDEYGRDDTVRAVGQTHRQVKPSS